LTSSHLVSKELTMRIDLDIIISFVHKSET